MNIAIAADPGTSSTDPVDHPDIARSVAVALQSDRAIPIWGSGIEACIAANKFRGIRAEPATIHFPPGNRWKTMHATRCAWGSALLGWDWPANWSEHF